MYVRTYNISFHIFLISCLDLFVEICVCVILFNTYARLGIGFKRIFWNNPTAETITLNAYTCLQGREGLKNRSYDTYVLNGWPQVNVVEYFSCTGTVKYTKASPPPRKMLLFPSIIIMTILSYAIIRVYIILHICL